MPQNKPDDHPDYQSVLAKVYEVLRHYVTDTDLHEESELVAEYGMTSLQVMEMIADIEDAFDISVPLNIVPNIATVGDLASEVKGLLA